MGKWLATHMDRMNLESSDLQAIPQIDSRFSGINCCLAASSTLPISKCVMKIHTVVTNFQSCVYRSGFYQDK